MKLIAILSAVALSMSAMAADKPFVQQEGAQCLAADTGRVARTAENLLVICAEGEWQSASRMGKPASPRYRYRVEHDSRQIEVAAGVMAPLPVAMTREIARTQCSTNSPAAGSNVATTERDGLDGTVMAIESTKEGIRTALSFNVATTTASAPIVVTPNCNLPNATRRSAGISTVATLVPGKTTSLTLPDGSVINVTVELIR